MHNQKKEGTNFSPNSNKVCKISKALEQKSAQLYPEIHSSKSAG